MNFLALQVADSQLEVLLCAVDAGPRNCFTPGPSPGGASGSGMFPRSVASQTTDRGASHCTAIFISIFNAELLTRYFCLLLCGFSGMVISNDLSAIKGFRYFSLNLVRFFHPIYSMSSVIVFGSLQKFSKRRVFGSKSNLVPTWSQLGPNLVPTVF